MPESVAVNSQLNMKNKRWIYGGEAMKKGAALLLVLLLLMSVAAVATGCKSDSLQAMQYMEAGDVLLEEYESKATFWSDQINSLSANPETIADEVQQVKITGEELLGIVQGAKSEYQKIMEMTNSGDYREYAELRIAELEILDQMIKKMHAFLDERVAMVQSEDLSNYPALQQKVQDEVDPLVNEGQEIEQRAVKLKLDSGL